ADFKQLTSPEVVGVRIGYLDTAGPDGVLRQGAAGFHVPAAQVKVIAEREHSPAVRREGERAPAAVTSMAGQAVDFAATLDGEQTHRIVKTRRGQQIAVGRESNVAHPVVKLMDALLLAGGRVPDAHAVVAAGRDDQAARRNAYVRHSRDVSW